eukprot:scaffold218_cov333-Prasinococcus_capsulatus_cf.AAC.14
MWGRIILGERVNVRAALASTPLVREGPPLLAGSARKVLRRPLFLRGAAAAAAAALHVGCRREHCSRAMRRCVGSAGDARRGARRAPHLPLRQPAAAALSVRRGVELRERQPRRSWAAPRSPPCGSTRSAANPPPVRPCADTIVGWQASTHGCKTAGPWLAVADGPVCFACGAPVAVLWVRVGLPRCC